jgi:hypothetical protein
MKLIRIKELLCHNHGVAEVSHKHTNSNVSRDNTRRSLNYSLQILIPSLLRDCG